MSDSIPNLPVPIRDLRTLALNLRWSWHRPTRELFEKIDPELWHTTRRNPLRILRETAPARLENLSWDVDFVAAVQAQAADLRRYLEETDTWWRRHHGQLAGNHLTAYFCAEFAIADCLPIYAGGLGVLAGDHLKSASDLGIPLVGVGLLYREGYFRQSLDRHGHQRAEYPAIDPADLPLTLEVAADGWPVVVRIPMLNRLVYARIWRADVGRVRLYLLDTDVDGNSPEDRRITDRLYGGDNEHRLQQEIVLGIGGMRALAALGQTPTVVHLNEGHAAFAAIERARAVAGESGGALRAATGPLAQGVIFTTHTPVPAGHDHFPPELVERYLGGYVWEMRESWDSFVSLGRRPGHRPDIFCMTTLAMRTAARRNGVSRLHGEVTRHMWQSLWPERAESEVPIGHVTNGVHLATWASREMERLFDEYMGTAWRDEADDVHWHPVLRITLDRLWATRGRLRTALVRYARQALARQVARAGGDPSWTERALDPRALTIVFARRFATYKRATLLLSDPDRLVRLLNGPLPVQFVFAGKAHPMDHPGQELLQQIAQFAARPDVRERFVFLEDYDLVLAMRLVHGADVWLNVPRRPHEASGTSGMKAALNGALNLSISDGWWAEAWAEHNRLPDDIGWCIATRAPADDPDAADAAELYRLLEDEVVPLFYDRNEEGVPEAWLRRVRASIRQVAPFFSTHRMVAQYADEMYVPAHWESTPAPGLSEVAEGA